MIGKTFSYSENKVRVTRKVLSESIQYGRMIYHMIDPSDPDKKERTAIADMIDQRFKVIPGKVKPRHSKR